VFGCNAFFSVSFIYIIRQPTKSKSADRQYMQFETGHFRIRITPCIFFLLIVWPPLRNQRRCSGLLLPLTIPRGGRAPHTHARAHTLSLSLERTTLDEELARRRNLYLTTHNIHERQTSMPLAGFQPEIPASKRPQTPLRTSGHRDRSVYSRSW